MLFFIAGSLAYFLLLILLSKKGKSLADRILAAWMFVVGTHLVLHAIDSTGLMMKYPFLEGTPTPFPLLHGPLLFLYAKSLTGNERRLGTWDYLHFLPAILVVVYMIPFFLLSGPEKMEYVAALADQGSTFLTIVLYSYMVSGVTYVTITLLLLRRHRQNLKINFSNTDKVNLNWLRYLTIGMIVIWTIVTVGYIFVEAFDLNIGNIVDFMIFTALSCFVLMIGYFGIRQTTIFSGNAHVYTPGGAQIEQVDEKTDVRYRKSGLSSEQGDALQVQLESLMLTEKPYLDDTLTLTSLSEMLDIHSNYLSQVINERFEKNFYDYINSARVEEFKILAQQPRAEHLTLLALAFECGFSSKSSFNKFFKKSTGQTPSEFMRTQKK